MRAFSAATRSASSSISMPSARGTPIISAPSASTPEPVPTSSTASGGGDLHGVLERFETQRGRRVQSGAERRGVDQSEGAGLRLGVSRNNAQAADANRARAEDPDRSGVAPDGRRDARCRVDAERRSRRCSGATLSGIRAAIPPSARARHRSRRARRADRGHLAATSRRSTRYGTLQRSVTGEFTISCEDHRKSRAHRSPREAEPGQAAAVATSSARAGWPR